MKKKNKINVGREFPNKENLEAYFSKTATLYDDS